MNWRDRARDVRTEAVVLALAARDPRVGWLARGIIAVSVAYALSPVDLIPDFVPVLGYVDDLLIVPLGLVLARRLIPADVLDDCRERVRRGEALRGGRNAIAAVVATWVVAAVIVGVAVWRIAT